MADIHVLTGNTDPKKLWVWRDHTDATATQLAYPVSQTETDQNGLSLFRTEFDHQLHEQAHFKLFSGDYWEKNEHNKTMPRSAHYRLADKCWCAEGCARVVTDNPFELSCNNVRIHLVTANRYRKGKCFIWGHGNEPVYLDAAGEDTMGPYFDYEVEGFHRHMFLFKFMSADGSFEPDFANKLWHSYDGGEIWVHSQSSTISINQPEKKKINIQIHDFSSHTLPPQLHIWQNDSDYSETISLAASSQRWFTFEPSIYSERTYGFMLQQPEFDNPWEHDEARRSVILKKDGLWTTSGDGSLKQVSKRTTVYALEGDRHLFGKKPAANRTVTINVADHTPSCPFDQPTAMSVRVNRARSPFIVIQNPNPDGNWSFKTFPQIVSSIRFSGDSAEEPLERHTLKTSVNASEEQHLFAVLGRKDLLHHRPETPLFINPPFWITRPGVWIADGFVRFAFHCPDASSVCVIGEWTGWQSRPLQMKSTTDGTYWWAQVPQNEITTALGVQTVHGVMYKFMINQTRPVQDPAADWVENSDLRSASKLVDHSLFQWQSDSWQRPGWEYLVVYQLHPSHFSQRNGTHGLDGITRELSDPDGYLNSLDATALLLMPTCEFQGDHGWGYNPSFFYSVESAYGGPDALKRLVDACHSRGKAVLLDVVFNHAGTSDNILWNVAHTTYFDGDTDWGAMINFDNPQVIQFFQQNLIHFMHNYRIDGFRFDFTRVIRYGGTWSSHVKQPGSGGGWEFLHYLRAAAHSVDNRCLLMAENLPNDWDLTRYGGVMDTQWCDNFHDRLVDASRGWDVMSELAEAMKITHTACNQWYESTNYAESHDEVGNEPNRIASVAGMGQGLRRNKVTGAAALFSRGIPMFFMGEESGEWRQFPKAGDATLDLDFYEQDENAINLRRWWNRLIELRRGNSRVEGSSPISVCFAQDRMIAFTRGEGSDLFVILNFGEWSGWRPLSELNLPQGEYKELLNSTWGDYRITSEQEDEHSNGGWDASLHRDSWLNIPDYGVVVLEKR